MKRFANLFFQLDETSKPDVQIELLVEYLRDASHLDAAWCLGLLFGHRPRRTVVAGKLKQWCIEVTGIPEWLMEESRSIVGDVGETVALLLPMTTLTSDASLSDWIESRLLPLLDLSESEKKASTVAAWLELDGSQRVVFNKLLIGSLKVRISEKLIVCAIAKLSGLPVDVIAFRLKGKWQPATSFFESLIEPRHVDAEVCRPYPFCLARPFFPVEGLEAGREESADHKS